MLVQGFNTARRIPPAPAPWSVKGRPHLRRLPPWQRRRAPRSEQSCWCNWWKQQMMSSFPTWAQKSWNWWLGLKPVRDMGLWSGLRWGRFSFLWVMERNGCADMGLLQSHECQIRHCFCMLLYAFVCFCYFHVYQRLGFETLTLVTLALKLSAAHCSKGLGKKANMFASLIRKHINK